MLSPSVKLINVAKKHARERLVRKTVRPGRAYVSRVGYNTVCSTYLRSENVDRFTGSSLNREKSDKRRYEFRQLAQKSQKIASSVGSTIDDQYEYQRQILCLRAAAANKQAAKRKLSASRNKCQSPVHMLSVRSKGKIRDKATAFYRATEKDNTFATLTFIADVSDAVAIGILNKFLTVLRKLFNRKIQYLWVAERQENGRIHFHIIFDCFVDVKYANSLWVLQQYNSGLKFQGITRAEILYRYDNGTIDEVLNPFHIEKIQSIYGLSYYLTKYITKNKSEGFQCAAWHCSRGVSKLFTKVVCSLGCLQAAAGRINTRKCPKTGKIKKGINKKGPFYNLYYIENRLYFIKQLAEVEQLNIWILQGFLPDEIPEVDDGQLCKFYNN